MFHWEGGESQPFSRLFSAVAAVGLAWVLFCFCSVREGGKGFNQGWDCRSRSN